MSSTTGIEWTDATWNPTVGCTKVSEGCRNCYAMRMAARIAAAADAIVRKGGEPGPKRRAYAMVVRRATTERGVRTPLPQWNNRVVCVEEALEIPLRWRTPRRIFVDSESDLFHEDVPFAFIDKVLAVAALCPRHTFQILTKRPERMAEYLNARRVQVLADEPLTATTAWYVWSACTEFEDHRIGRLSPLHWAGFPHPGPGGQHVHGWPLPNVWLGTSVEDQKTADKRIPELLKCPAAVRFLSCEPLLGPIQLRAWLPGGWVCHACGLVSCTPEPMADEGEASPRCRCGAGEPRIEHRTIDWVIGGGESGPGARPCELASLRDIVEACKRDGVPCFVKQLGAVPTACLPDGRPVPCGEWNIPRATLSRITHKAPPGAIRLRDRKGGEPSEWPADLRVREMPALAGGAA